ncbi:glycosyltransferase family protein [Leucobacter iarius]|uniref:Spore protein YkvP/CgeB glycosyl transferase-like domain-containing protein n=1 Tax=Leucobacter iarius TaxID=333963 RepID=A0ABN2LA41_9MICO
MPSPAEIVARVLARRHRFPGWVNRAIDGVVDHPPTFLLRWLSPASRSAAPGEIPAPPQVPENQAERVVIGPVNYSGQGLLWARALQRARPQNWSYDFAIEVPGGFAFDTDTEVPLHVHASSRAWQDAQLAAIERCTHVLVEAERPLLGRRFADFEAEARELRARGLSVAFLAHGTDIRVPSLHVPTTHWSVFQDTDAYWGRQETLATRNLAALRRLGGPFFVSTPDLKYFLPEAEWCPVVVDPEKWAGESVAGDREVPVVAHVPSQAKTKGTDLVEPVLFALQEEGLIEYRPVRGVPSARMPEVYGAADIVLDQFRLGSYGVTACEAMSSGRVVLGHVSPEVREWVRSATGEELPIVEADPDTVETELRALLADRAEMRRIGAAGAEFVRAVHDGRMSAAVLGAHWLDVEGSGRGA